MDNSKLMEKLTQEESFLKSIYADGNDLIEVTLENTDFLSLEDVLKKHKQYLLDNSIVIELQSH